MQENLVIVESPAKAKTIEKFLGKDYKVMSSYGHIRDLKKSSLSLDPETLEPTYVIPSEKKKVVSDLKKNANEAQKIWLASDEDREGEAISWHLCEVLGLDEQKTSRIVFHEITKPAILEAIGHPRHLDMNLVNAQQARRVLDRLVGFKLSPVLWRKVKPSLSAGRVQSVAVRLIVEREREIQGFKSEPYYRVSAVFLADGNEVKADLDTHFKTLDEAKAFLEKCKNATFTVRAISKKPVKRSPAPPFTTSTLQQEAARKLGYSVTQTMRIAQQLYENGKITYMRTDSVNLSSLAIGTAKETITTIYGEQYSKPRNYTTHSKGAQEAHEAIRPTWIKDQEIEGSRQEQHLYSLIWKRTVASQMADAQIEKTSVTIDIDMADEHFVAQGEVVLFDGFLKVYRESSDDDSAEKATVDNDGRQLPRMTEGQHLDRKEITATQRFSQGPSRYNEASLVHKLEELGIGRPSTYAPTISTIQQRGYVEKGDKKGTERAYDVVTLKGNAISVSKKTEMAGSDRGKLLPTDIGIVTNDFLVAHFPTIMDYNFTANVEGDFDKIAEGKEEWKTMLQTFDKNFEPAVQRVIDDRSEHKAGERQLGINPADGKPVFVKIGRFGPVAQIGIADEENKPRYAQIPRGLSMETITLEEALDLFKLPRTVGNFEGTPVVIGSGKYGPYVSHDKKYVSLPKDADPMAVTLEEAIKLILQKRDQEKQRHLKTFAEDPKMEVMNGRFGPYITYDGKNYRLPRDLRAKAADLTYEECKKVVDTPQETKTYRRKKQ